MPTNREKRIKRYVRKLLALEDNCLKSRRRYWADQFLIRIYKLYTIWKIEGVDARRKDDLIKYVLKVPSVRSDKTLLHIMFDCMSRATPKDRNRWTRALLMAEIEKIKPEALGDYLRRKGGIARRANDYATYKGNQKAIKAKPSDPSSKVSSKNVTNDNDDDEWD